MIETRIPLDPQPKHGLPFQVHGDKSGRFYNDNPRFPKSSLNMISHAWRPPAQFDPATVRVERSPEGIYEWVGTTKEGIVE